MKARATSTSCTCADRPGREIQTLLARNRIAIADALLSPIPAVIEPSVAAVEANSAKITALWASFNSLPQSAEEAQLAQTFAARRGAFVQEGLQKTVAALRESDIAQANTLAMDVVAPLYEPVAAGIDALVRYQSAQAQQEYAQTVAQYEWLRGASIAAMLLGVLGAVCFGLFLVRGITRPLARAVAAADAIANGDLGADLVADSQDETGQLLAAMGRMQTVLQGFEAAQTEMARQHGLGVMDYKVDTHDLRGIYASMADTSTCWCTTAMR